MAELETQSEVQWQALRDAGIKYLQEMSGHIWTDYNIHDPGVTILEALCYAISDLENRLENDIQDILTPEERTGENQFFSPGEMLTINPLTVNDYRKLLIDIPGVKNAWLISATDLRPDLYYDKDNYSLVYDFAPGAERISLKGLYRVFIEKERDVTDETLLLSEIRKKLYSHRNLCEDFSEIKIMDQEKVSLFTDIIINEDEDPEELAAHIYRELENFISPRVGQYSLKRMLKKGKSMEDIFNGPSMFNGFIDDDELGSGKKRKELHTSDLIRIIMGHKTVRDVRNLFVSLTPNPTAAEKKEWALPLDDTRAVILEEFNGTRIRFFKGDTMCPISANRVTARIKELEALDRYEILDNPAMDLEEPSGTYLGLDEYSSVTYTLPATYGIGETGLPTGASPARRGWARQLKGYLLFFEQILINYFKQLDSFRMLFAFRQDNDNILKTYYSTSLPGELWENDFPEAGEGYNFVEDEEGESLLGGEKAFNRKNRILNHLLSQFNEKFSDYALFGLKQSIDLDMTPGEKKKSFLKSKAAFLKDYPSLSRNRNRGVDYLYEVDQGICGLRELIAAKLGLDGHAAGSGDRVEYDNFHIVEHILLRPSGVNPLDFIACENVDDKYQPDPYSYRLTFVISERAGRFRYSKFKELVYSTIKQEVPAHLSYEIVELNPDEMAEFKESSTGFMTGLKNYSLENSGLYNSFRDRLISLLGVGRVKLPVLHLDAYDVSGDGSRPENGSSVRNWIDLSRKGNDTRPRSGNSIPKFVMEGDLPFIRFAGMARYRIDNPVIRDDFTIAVVYKTLISGNYSDGFVSILCGDETPGDHFSLSADNTGRITAEIGTSALLIESTQSIPHLAVFTRSRDTGELCFSLDGKIQDYADFPDSGLSLEHESLFIGPGRGQAVVCFVGEIIVLDSVLSGSKLDKLQDSLSQKWRIPLSAVNSVAMPRLFLDALNGNSIHRDNETDRVREWEDLSLPGSGANQDSTGLQPVYTFSDFNNKPAIQFSGTYFKITDSREIKFFSGDFTLVMVVQAEEGVLLDCSGDTELTGAVLSVEKNGSFLLKAGIESFSVPAEPGVPHLFVLSGRRTSSGIDLSISLDGKSMTRQNFTKPDLLLDGSDDFLLGGSRHSLPSLSGLIGEVLVFGDPLSIWQRQRLEEFLGRKWGLDISGINSYALPLGHYDASKLITLEDEDGCLPGSGEKIYFWRDRGPYGNDLVQDNSDRQPVFLETGISNQGSLYFLQDSGDYYEDYLKLDQIVKEDFTIMVVFQADAGDFIGKNDMVLLPGDTPNWTRGAAIIDADCSGFYNDFGLSLGISNNKFVVMGGIGDRLTKDHTIKTGEIEPGVPHLITFTRLKETGYVSLYADGLLQSEADLRDNVVLNDSRTIRVGAFNSEGIPFKGMIGEIIILNKVLEKGVQQEVEKYLSLKWNIPLLSLPVDNNSLRFHLDAADSGSIEQDDEGRVYAWHDEQDLRAVTALQDVDEKRPYYRAGSINRMPGIRFNNSYMLMDPGIVSYEQFTIAMVFVPYTSGNIKPGWDKGAALFDTVDTSGNHFSVSTNKNNTLSLAVGGETYHVPVSMEEPHILLITAGDNVEIHLDGLLVLSEDFNPGILVPGTPFILGAVSIEPGQVVSRGYYHGDISELIFLDAFLALPGRQELERYLAMKWKLDITGIGTAGTPVLHLDASRIATIVAGASAGSVAGWLDLNSHDTNAVEERPELQPAYRSDVFNNLGGIRFDNHMLTIPRVIENDFTLIIIYRSDVLETNYVGYMPVPGSAFETPGIISSALSLSIWNQLVTRGVINKAGIVQEDIFTPGESEFSLGLNSVTYTNIRNLLEPEIIAVMDTFSQELKPVPPDGFTVIDGIEEKISDEIWELLRSNGYLNDDGRVVQALVPGSGSFFLTIIDAHIIHRLLAENWIEGVGLFDGNAPGERWDLHKRDFGLLLKDNTLIAAMGIPGEGDIKLETYSESDRIHVGIFTREKSSGRLNLQVDSNPPVTGVFAAGMSLKDSPSFSLGAVNPPGNFFKGEIGEVVIFDEVLTEEKLSQVREYLSRKWGIL